VQELLEAECQPSPNAHRPTAARHARIPGAAARARPADTADHPEYPVAQPAHCHSVPPTLVVSNTAARTGLARDPAGSHRGAFSLSSPCRGVSSTTPTLRAPRSPACPCIPGADFEDAQFADGITFAGARVASAAAPEAVWPPGWAT
jgi:hypothetical protein